MPETSGSPEKKVPRQTDQPRFLRSFNIKIDKPMMAEIFINSLGIHLRQIPDLVIKSMNAIRDPFATQNKSEEWNRVEKLMRAINSVLIPSSAKPDAFGNFHIWDVEVQYEVLLPKLLPYSRSAFDWVQAGEAFFQANLWREAELAHRIALHCEPGDPAIQSYIADDLDKQGLFGEAEQLLAELVEDHPTLTPARTNLSHLRLFSMNDVGGAGQTAAKATQVGPDDPDAWVQYAYCLYYAGKKEKASIASQNARQCAQGGDSSRVERLLEVGFKMLDAAREMFRKEAAECASFIHDVQREGGLDEDRLGLLIKTHEDFCRRNRLNLTG